MTSKMSTEIGWVLRDMQNLNRNSWNLFDFIGMHSILLYVLIYVTYVMTIISHAVNDYNREGKIYMSTFYPLIPYSIFVMICYVMSIKLHNKFT